MRILLAEDNAINMKVGSSTNLTAFRTSFQSIVRYYCDVYICCTPPVPSICYLPVLIRILFCFALQVALGILRRGGHTDVAVAENGQVALDVIAARGGIDKFDLILMDLHMPVMVSCCPMGKNHLLSLRT